MGGAVGGLVNKLTGADKAAKAAKKGSRQSLAAQMAMFNKSLGLQREMWDYQKGVMAPWQEAGLRGLEGYEGLMEDPSSITSDPGYQFRFSEGQRALGSSYMGKGLGLSGAAAKAMTNYGQDYASGEYSNALNRFATLANYGSGAVAGQTGASQVYGSSMSNISSRLASGLAEGYQNQGQIGAAAAMGPYNAMMGAGQMAIGAYGAGMFGGGGGGAGSVPVGGASNVPMMGRYYNPLG